MAAGSRSEDDEDLCPNVSSSKHHNKRVNNQLHRNGGSSNNNGNMAKNNDNDEAEPRRPYSPVAETLFRKDLISAMKLPDNEPLTEEDFWLVTDPWKQEWEQGVQVPFNPGGLPVPHVSRLANPPHSDNRFTFPKKLMCMSRRYSSDTHQVTTTAIRSEQMCNYDLDDMDLRWLSAVNGERALMGSTTISELEMERGIEDFEKQCWEKINITRRNNEALEDQDDSIICDVCRSPDSEECNEMVFCDKCNICVHQACYGITNIPSGPWLCRTCALNITPKCELCPNKGGAMKATKTGKLWAHVSCALWIPEVSIGNVEKMEPITKISSIPSSRWNLLCVLCKDRVGSCIQCSVKTCKVAYHVTCAFKRGLEMRAIIEDENADDGVQLRSYCQNHSLNQKRPDLDDFGERQNMTTEERSLARRQKILKIESEFYKPVDLNQASRKLGLELEVVDLLYRYWILKRRSLANQPLFIPRVDDPEAAASSASSQLGGNQSAEDNTQREKLKRFVAFRQDLERVRNLCYMISRREKLKKSMVKSREQIFEKQLGLVTDEANASQMSLVEMSAILEANHGPGVYDRLFAHADAEVASENDFEIVISRISGEITENSAQIRKDNPYRNSTNSTIAHPASNDKLSYKRIFSDTSASETEELWLSSNSSSKNNRKNSSKSLLSTAEAAAKNAAAIRKQLPEAAGKGRKKSGGVNKKLTTTVLTRSSSSESLDVISKSKSKTKAKKMTTAEAKAAAKKSIFSDSDSEESSSKRPRSPMFRTKAAMKDFSVEGLPRGGAGSKVAVDKTPVLKKKPAAAINKSSTSSSASSSSSDDSDHESKSKKATKAATKKSRSKESDFYPMIVPERAAARKATAKLSEKKPDDKAATGPLAPTSKASLKKGHDDTMSRKSSSKKAAKERSKVVEETDEDEDIKEEKPPMPPPTEVLLGYVPQRKAALKASAQIKDADRRVSAKEEALLLFGEEPSSKKSKKSSHDHDDKSLIKKGHLPPLRDRLNSPGFSDSDSLDEEPFRVRSPRGKSSRGRSSGGAVQPRSPRKSYKSKRPPEIKKAMSSRVEALLNARGAQLDDIFVECGLKAKPEPEPEPEQQPQQPLPDVVSSASANNKKKKKSSLSCSSSSSSSGGSSSDSDSSQSNEDEDRVEPPRRGDRGHEVERQQQLRAQGGAPASPPEQLGVSVKADNKKPEPSPSVKKQQPEKEEATDFFFAKPGGKIGQSRQPAPFKDTNQIPPTPGAGLIAAGRLPGGRVQSDDEEEDLGGGGEPLSPQASPPPSPTTPPVAAVVHRPKTPNEAAEKPSEVTNVTMEESLALVDKLKKTETSQQQQPPQAAASKDEGYVSAELAQAEQASELLAKLPTDSPLLQAVEAMAKQQQQQLELMGYDAASFNQSSSTSQSAASTQNQTTSAQQNRWMQQQQQQQQQQSHHGYHGGSGSSSTTSAAASQQQKQNEMLYNYFYNTGKLPQTYAQNAFGFTQEQMKQFYGPNLANVDLLTYYQQQQQYNLFMQQQMQQYPNAAAAAAAQFKKSTQAQAFEQLMQWTPHQLAASVKWQQQQQTFNQQSQPQQQQPQPQQQQQLQQQQQQPDLSKVQTATSTSTAARRPANRDSPMRPAQSPRGGGQHFHQSDHIPSATSLRHLPGYKGHEQPSSQPPSDGISKDLLESVAGLAKLPVWKPTEKPAAGSPVSAASITPVRPPLTNLSSPSKTPVNVTDVTPEHHPGSLRRTSSVASDKDKTFEDLVKRVESSPAHQTLKKHEANAVSERGAESMSDLEKSDYDDMKGGVDYDDFDYEDEYLPRSTRRTGGAKSRGRAKQPPASGRGALAKARTFKSRGRGRTRPVTIDTKGLEKVHRTVAGTDYDFEDEFDDDHSREPKGSEVTLQDLREQSKKQNNLPIYMQRKEDDSRDEFDFMIESKPLAASKTSKKAAAAVRGAKTNNRGRGRPRRDTRRSSFDFEDDNDEVDGGGDDLEKKIDMPKLPKLKLGAMLASRKESEKHHRRESNESLEASAAKVPKLKIKLGPKPSEVAKDEKVDEKGDAVIIKPPEPAAAEKAISPIEASAEVTKPSPASSPTKKGFRIDSLAEKLLKQTSTSNDLMSIFGPSGAPLDMTSVPLDKAKVVVETASEKSELDLIREEVEAATKASSSSNFIQSSPAGASPHADTVYGPLKKAINASRSAAEKEQQKAAVIEHVEHYDMARKHLKFKFKVDDRHPASTTPPPPPVSAAALLPTTIPLAATSSMASSMASSMGSSHHRRMNRKKELLNQYYGQDIYPAPSNGPSTATPTSMLNSYDSLSNYAGIEQQQQQQPQPPPRPIIKMPKAVASVTSVPTRADYQQQLEANLERKRKREKGDLGSGLKNDSGAASGSGFGKGADKGKKKRGRGAAASAKEDMEYKPKIIANSMMAPPMLATSNHTKGVSMMAAESEKMRKTRGKPPKKCLADSPTHEPGDLKAESMKFAEEIRAQFDEPNVSNASNKGRKKKRKVEADEAVTPVAKTPRLVIKFSKDSVAKENGGRGDEYDFNDDDVTAAAAAAADKMAFVDGTVDSALSSVNNSPAEAKVNKLKIKI